MNKILKTFLKKNLNAFRKSRETRLKCRKSAEIIDIKCAENENLKNCRLIGEENPE